MSKKKRKSSGFETYEQKLRRERGEITRISSSVIIRDRRSLGSRLFLLTLLFLLIASIGVAWGTYITNQRRSDQVDFFNQIVESSDLLNIEEDQQGVEEVIQAPSVKKRFAIKNPAYHLKGYFFEVDESPPRLEQVFIKVTTPEPPDLSDLQIVNKEKREPWLEKILVDGIEIRQQEDGSYIGSGNAKAFIDYDNRTLRKTVKVVVSGVYNHPRIELRVILNHGFDEIPQESYIFTKADKRNYQIYLDTAKKVYTLR